MVDTDDLAREVVAPGQPALAAVRDAFGDAVIRTDGSLDRARLAERVFRDAGERTRLEQILHPRIRELWMRRVGEWRQAGAPCAAVVIPLLYETAAEGSFDAVLCVACTNASQRLRLRERGWADDQRAGRIAAQLPIETKILKAQFLIWTEPPPAEQETQLRRVLETLGVTPAADRKSPPPA